MGLFFFAYTPDMQYFKGRMPRLLLLLLFYFILFFLFIYLFIYYFFFLNLVGLDLTRLDLYLT